jgi:hypothetical protein
LFFAVLALIVLAALMMLPIFWTSGWFVENDGMPNCKNAWNSGKDAQTSVRPPWLPREEANCEGHQKNVKFGVISNNYYSASALLFFFLNRKRRESAFKTHTETEGVERKRARRGRASRHCGFSSFVGPMKNFKVMVRFVAIALAAIKKYGTVNYGFFWFACLPGLSEDEASQLQLGELAH